MTIQSAVYEGWVRHRRFTPVPHEFRYALFLMYLDLDELPHLFRGHFGWGYEKIGLASFRRADYLGDPRQPLDAAVRDVVESRLGWRPAGPVRMLTHLRYVGYVFNPVSLYFCHGDDGQTVESIVLDVQNTPWGQRHAYVLDARSPRPGKAVRCSQQKVFHVSPFMSMDVTYQFLITPPAEQLTIHMDCHSPTSKTLDATLQLERCAWSRSTLTRSLLRFPWMTGQVMAAIYWQAFRLWWKRCPYHTNPHEISSDEPTAPRRPAAPLLGPGPSAASRTLGTQPLAQPTGPAS